MPCQLPSGVCCVRLVRPLPPPSYASPLLFEGRFVKSGGKELALLLEERGYEWIEEEVRAAAR